MQQEIYFVADVTVAGDTHVYMPRTEQGLMKRSDWAEDGTTVLTGAH